jgi:hypothetical protein
MKREIKKQADDVNCIVQDEKGMPPYENPKKEIGGVPIKANTPPQVTS